MALNHWAIGDYWGIIQSVHGEPKEFALWIHVILSSFQMTLM